MKLKPLIFLLFFTYPLFLFSQQKTFNWNDTIFEKGAIHRIKVEYGLDDCGITPASRDTLNYVVRFMKQNPTIKIEIDSHTDPQGSDKHNLVLSHARAQSCVDYIISQGIDSARLVAKGWGNHKPLPGKSAADIANMKTQQEKEAAWQADRRTEVKIIAPDSGNIFKWDDDRFMKYSRRVIRVHYGIDSASLSFYDSLQQTIDTLVNFLKFHPYLKVGIYVHTDPRGSVQHSMNLGQARAQAVTNLFISKGIDSARIVPRGWNSTRPLPGCSAKDIAVMKTQQEKEIAWQKDRRTEIVILGTIKVTSH